MKSNVPTAHNEAKLGDIAKTVLMPGDPKRAKFIADTFLENAKMFNNVRGMKGFTGTYKGRKISVMGSGMGMPSIGIYSYELFKFYGVENIVRIGSCGAYTKELNLYDVVLAKDVWSESTFAKIQSGYQQETIEPNEQLNSALIKIAESLAIDIELVKVHSSDVFYREKFTEYIQIRDEKKCQVVEMEAFALFANAKILGKKAACLLTVSDNLETKQATNFTEREKTFTKMMKIALELAE